MKDATKSPPLFYQKQNIQLVKQQKYRPKPGQMIGFSQVDFTAKKKQVVWSGIIKLPIWGASNNENIW